MPSAEPTESAKLSERGDTSKNAIRKTMLPITRIATNSAATNPLKRLLLRLAETKPEAIPIRMRTANIAASFGLIAHFLADLLDEGNFDAERFTPHPFLPPISSNLPHGPLRRVPGCIGGAFPGVLPVRRGTPD